MTRITELFPTFEGVWFVDDNNILAAQNFNKTPLLSARDARIVLQNPTPYPYQQIKQPNGKPYAHIIEDGVLKRHYIFVDPEAPQDPSSAIDFVFTVHELNNIIVCLPHEVRRGQNADFIASVTHNCCSGGRTMLYSDTGVHTQKTIFNMASSGSDMVAEIRQAWQNTQALSLNNEGLAALHHLILDMTGHCSPNHHNHAHLSQYTQQKNWKGAKLTHG